MSLDITQLGLSPVKRQGSLSVHVADQLEALIANKKISVGEKLPTEGRLCESFGVSRTVVREAITQLKSVGLVETRRGVGTTVLRSSVVEPRPAERISSTTVADILHVLELRLAMEPAAAELAAQRHDAQDIQRLNDSHAAFIAAQTFKTQARDEDFAFHQAIAKATKNPVFETMFELLDHRVIPRAKLLSIDINPQAAERYLERVREEHALVLEAILSRDADAARETMFQHLNRARHMYAQFQPSERSER